MLYTKNLSDLTSKDMYTAGGKGASLGEMIRAGFCVPEGFVVKTECFEMILDAGSLREKIITLMGNIQYVDIRSIERASKKIQGLVQRVKIPMGMAREIEKAYKALGMSYVAVRSSATAEDGQEHTWAGQFTSYLYVSRADMLARLVDCWASFYSPRALCYRFENGLTQSHVGIAVVIQKMVESEISGVAFSIHPVSQNKNQVIIEAGFGLGEAIVSGSITPDSYVIEKKSKNIISTKIETQTKTLCRSKNGLRWRTVSKSRALSQKLTHNQILALAQKIIDIEHYYRYPCDIEWAYEKGVFFIVQCRPVTTLHKAQKTQTILTKFKILGEYDILGQWVAPTIESQTWLDWAKTVDARSFNLDTHPLDTIVITGHYFLLKQGPYSQLQKIFEREFQTNNFTKSKKIIYLAKMLSDRCSDMVNKFGPNISCADFIRAYRLLCRLRFPWMACSPLGEAGKVFLKQRSETNHIPSIDTILTTDQKYLFACKKLLKKSRQQAEKQIRAYQEKTKYIGTYHFWGKGRDMDSLLNAIKKSRPVSTSSESNINFDIAKNESTPLTLISQAIRWRVDCAQSSAYLAYALRPFLTKLATSHNITYDDIIFLTTTEISNLYQGKELKNMLEIIRTRQQGFGLLKMTTQNNSLLVPTGEHLYELEKQFGLLKKYQSKAEITGTIGNKGIVQGTIALVFKPSDQTKVKPGMIMVSPETTPNLLPAMVRAAAFVTDQGGITSHAAIIAREMNKPCIIATQNATKILRDGDRVEVDAYTGVVRILKSL